MVRAVADDQEPADADGQIDVDRKCLVCEWAGRIKEPVDTPEIGGECRSCHATRNRAKRRRRALEAAVIDHPRHVGSAGWNIPRLHRGRFAADGSQLQRYASRLNAAEINSSFYRPHAAS